MTHVPATSRIERGDPSVFTITSALSESDRRTFLALQNLVAQSHPGFCYLEVGSDLGGSLIAPLLDPRCAHLVSVDLRPPSQPDARGRAFPFPNNSTRRMIATLREKGVSEDQLRRLVTFDGDLADLPASMVRSRARLAFIDAEHTTTAVFQDFLNIEQHLERDAIVAFHDANLVFDGLLNIRAMLQARKAEAVTAFLPDTIFVIGLGRLATTLQLRLGPAVLDERSFLARSRAALAEEIRRSLEASPPPPVPGQDQP